MAKTTKTKRKARTSQKPRASSKTEETQETEAPEHGELTVARAAEPDAEYLALVERGKAAVAGMGRSLWELGEVALEVDTRYGENSLGEYADRIGVPLKTLQAARTTARRWPEKSRRLDFSTCQALNAQIDRENIVRQRPDITLAEARELVRRRKDARADLSPVERLVGKLNRNLLAVLETLTALNDQQAVAMDGAAKDDLEDKFDALRIQAEAFLAKVEVSPPARPRPYTEEATLILEVNPRVAGGPR
jgi:hypothetical protein